MTPFFNSTYDSVEALHDTGSTKTTDKAFPNIIKKKLFLYQFL